MIAPLRKEGEGDRWAFGEDATEDRLAQRHRHRPPRPRRCRVCGCTDQDVQGCLARTGRPCHWVEVDLCSACARPGGGGAPWA